MKTIKEWFQVKPSKIKILEEKVNDLEERTFKEEKEIDWMGWYSPFYNPKSLEEEIMDLKDKVDSLCRHLKVYTIKTEAEWTVKNLPK